MPPLEDYCERLVRRTLIELERYLSPEQIGVTARQAFAFHANSGRSMNFQRYYFQLLQNLERNLQEERFFRRFKGRYSLSGIDGDYLDELEHNKNDIVQRIRDDDLAGVHAQYFAAAEIKYGDEIRAKDLGSFFSKLTHTVRPAEYCALDNPIRRRLGLQRESFFMAFVVASRAYRDWSGQNRESIGEIREAFLATPPLAALSDDPTDLKLLDLIFWHQANV